MSLDKERLEIDKEINDVCKDTIKEISKKIISKLNDSQKPLNIDIEIIEILNELGKIGTIGGIAVGAYAESLSKALNLVNDQHLGKEVIIHLLQQLCRTDFAFKNKGKNRAITLPTINFNAINIPK